MIITIIMKIALLFVTLLSLFHSVSGFSTGAGRCVIGEPAPQGNHADPLEGEGGELTSGGYAITIDGGAVDGPVSVTAGTPFDIVVSGPAFRGFLIMLAGQPEGALEGPAGIAQQPFGANCAGTASVTHTSPDDKTGITATGTIDQAVTTTIEVNIVVENSGGNSLYYYTQIPLEVVATAAAPDGTTDPPTETPVLTTDPPTGSPVAPIPGGEVCAEGLIMDVFCLERGTLLDPSGIVTLLEPEKHTYHCLFDVQVCVDSGYTILKEPEEGEDMYSVAYAFDAESSAKLRELGQASGVCDTCSLTEGPTAGFRAGIKGMIIDSSVDPPLVSIMELEATDGTTDYCNLGSMSPDETSPEEMETESPPNGSDYNSGSFSARAAGATLLISALWTIFIM